MPVEYTGLWGQTNVMKRGDDINIMLRMGLLSPRLKVREKWVTRPIMPFS